MTGVAVVGGGRMGRTHVRELDEPYAAPLAFLEDPTEERRAEARPPGSRDRLALLRAERARFRSRELGDAGHLHRRDHVSPSVGDDQEQLIGIGVDGFKRRHCLLGPAGLSQTTDVVLLQ